MLLKTGICQRSAARSEHRRRVGNALGLMFQQVLEGRKQGPGF
jgi:hypothetical protein